MVFILDFGTSRSVSDLNVHKKRRRRKHVSQCALFGLSQFHCLVAFANLGEITFCLESDEVKTAFHANNTCLLKAHIFILPALDDDETDDSDNDESYKSHDVGDNDGSLTAHTQKSSEVFHRA